MRSRPRARHPQIHLPPLDPAYALTLVAIFERAIAAIWRAHGEHMEALLDRRAAVGRANDHESAHDRDQDGDNADEPDLFPF